MVQRTFPDCSESTGFPAKHLRSRQSLHMAMPSCALPLPRVLAAWANVFCVSSALPLLRLCHPAAHTMRSRAPHHNYFQPVDRQLVYMQMLCSGGSRPAAGMRLHRKHWVRKLRHVRGKHTKCVSRAEQGMPEWPVFFHTVQVGRLANLRRQNERHTSQHARPRKKYESASKILIYIYIYILHMFCRSTPLQDALATHSCCTRLEDP